MQELHRKADQQQQLVTPQVKQLKAQVQWQLVFMQVKQLKAQCNSSWQSCRQY
jgi:hypothetical protein